jgi:CheY-like chemotaxis protein
MARKAPLTPSLPARPRTRPMRILIADDSPVSCRLLEGTLKRWGHDVLVASDGLQA